MVSDLHFQARGEQSLRASRAPLSAGCAPVSALLLGAGLDSVSEPTVDLVPADSTVFARHRVAPNAQLIIPSALARRGIPLDAGSGTASGFKRGLVAMSVVMRLPGALPTRPVTVDRRGSRRSRKHGASYPRMVRYGR